MYPWDSKGIFHFQSSEELHFPTAEGELCEKMESYSSSDSSVCWWHSLENMTYSLWDLYILSLNDRKVIPA